MLGDGIFIHVKELKTNKYFISIFPVHSSCHFLITVQYHFYFLFFSSYLELQTFHSKISGYVLQISFSHCKKPMDDTLHLLSRIRIKALLIMTILHEVRKQGQFPSVVRPGLFLFSLFYSETEGKLGDVQIAETRPDPLQLLCVSSKILMIPRRFLFCWQKVMLVSNLNPFQSFTCTI